MFSFPLGFLRSVESVVSGRASCVALLSLHCLRTHPPPYAMAMAGARPGMPIPGSDEGFNPYHNRSRIQCTEEHHMSAIILTSLGGLGVAANLALMTVMLVKRPLRR